MYFFHSMIPLLTRCRKKVLAEKNTDDDSSDSEDFVPEKRPKKQPAALLANKKTAKEQYLSILIYPNLYKF